MTRQEAIYELSNIFAFGFYNDRVDEAANMAIKALEQEPTAEYSSDVISRQDAIDAVGKAMPQLTTPDGCGEFDHEIQIAAEAFSDCMKIINDLPSAQPERAIKEAEK